MRRLTPDADSLGALLVALDRRAPKSPWSETDLEKTWELPAIAAEPATSWELEPVGYRGSDPYNSIGGRT